MFGVLFVNESLSLATKDCVLVYNMTSCPPPLSQLHGRSEFASESSRFPHEEGAGLLCHGSGETSEAFLGHPGRVRAVHIKDS